MFCLQGYVLGAGTLIRNFSPAFVKLVSQEQLEGEYRQLHSRLRTHSESIAFYGGETREESHIQQKFKTLVKHMRTVLHDHWWFGMIQDFLVKYLGATVAVVLIIEPFFAGNLRPDSSTIGRAEMLSNLRYHTSVIISLFQSLGTLSISSRRLNRLRYLFAPFVAEGKYVIAMIGEVDSKLHEGMCKVLYAIYGKVFAIFPDLEAARPRSTSGIQALSSLHIALEKTKNVLQHWT